MTELWPWLLQVGVALQQLRWLTEGSYALARAMLGMRARMSAYGT